MTFIKTRDDTNLYVKKWGSGPAVMLIHGWPLTADSWDEVALALAENGFTAIAYDRRGFGRSDQPFKGYDYDTFADDLADVMKGCGVSDAALIGFSMGGGEVARYLSRHGAANIAKAGLIGAIVPYLAKTDDNPDGVPGELLETLQQQLREDRGKFYATFLNQFYGVGFISSPVSDEVIKGSWAQAMMAGLHPALASMRAWATDFRPDLEAFTVPTLIIHGTADKNVPIDPTARAAAKAIPNAKLIEYDGSPHGLFATDQQRFIGDLLAFLKDDDQGQVSRRRETDALQPAE